MSMNVLQTNLTPKIGRLLRPLKVNAHPADILRRTVHQTHTIRKKQLILYQLIV
ncbi:hypothetical protein D3C80_2067200 [compost metagenome]